MSEAQLAHIITVPMVLAFLGGIVWFVRLEGRVNLLDRILTDHLEDSKEVFKAFTEQLGRVEEKVDKLTFKCIATRAHTHWRVDDKIDEPGAPPDA